MPVLTVALSDRAYWENCFPPEELIKKPKPTKLKNTPQTKSFLITDFKSWYFSYVVFFIFQPFSLIHSMLQIFTSNRHFAHKYLLLAIEIHIFSFLTTFSKILLIIL